MGTEWALCGRGSLARVPVCVRTAWVRSRFGSSMHSNPGRESTTAFSSNMSDVVSVPQRPLNKRMRSKTTPKPQEALPEPLVLDPQAPEDVKQAAYLITFPHPRQATSATGIKLVAPSSLSKTEMIATMKDAFAHPIWQRADLCGGSIPVAWLGVRACPSTASAHTRAAL